MLSPIGTRGSPPAPTLTGLYSLSRLPGGLPIRHEQTKKIQTFKSDDLPVVLLDKVVVPHVRTRMSDPAVVPTPDFIHEHPESHLLDLAENLTPASSPKRNMAGKGNQNPDWLSIPERPRLDEGKPEDGSSQQVNVDGTSNRYVKTLLCLGQRSSVILTLPQRPQRTTSLIPSACLTPRQRLQNRPREYRQPTTPRIRLSLPNDPRLSTSSWIS